VSVCMHVGVYTHVYCLNMLIFTNMSCEEGLQNQQWGYTDVPFHHTFDSLTKFAFLISATSLAVMALAVFESVTCP